MSFEEALGVLGIGRAAGPKLARRAYLKLLKKHKPERDPEGFRRLRDAYELIEAQAWRWHVEASAGASTERAQNAQQQDAEPEAEGGLHGAPAGTMPDPDAHVTEVDDLTAVYDALSNCEDPAERRALCERAVDEHPGDPGAFLLLAEELEEQGDTEQAVETLRRGQRAGYTFMAQHILSRWPELAEPSEVRAGIEGEDPSSIHAAVAALLERGELIDIPTALERARKLLLAQDGEAYAYRSQLELVLRYYAASGDGQVRGLLARTHAQIADAGMQLELSRYGDLLLFQVSELLHNWSVLDAEDRRALCLLVAQPQSEDPRLSSLSVEYLRNKSPLRKLLRTEAPALDGTVAEHAGLPSQQDEQEAERFRLGDLGRIPWWAIMMLTWSVLRLAFGIIRDDDGERATKAAQAAQAAAPRPGAQQEPTWVAGLPGSLRDAHRALQAFCAPQRDAACRSATSAFELVAMQDDCSTVAATIQQLLEWTQQEGLVEREAELVTLARHVSVHCRGPAAGAPNRAASP